VGLPTAGREIPRGLGMLGMLAHLHLATDACEIATT
jgi:hypothetical protein